MHAVLRENTEFKKSVNRFNYMSLDPGSSIIAQNGTCLIETGKRWAAVSLPRMNTHRHVYSWGSTWKCLYVVCELFNLNYDCLEWYIFWECNIAKVNFNKKGYLFFRFKINFLYSTVFLSYLSCSLMRRKMRNYFFTLRPVSDEI